MSQQQHPRLRPAPLPVFPPYQNPTTRHVNPGHEQGQEAQALRELWPSDAHPRAEEMAGNKMQQLNMKTTLDHERKTNSYA